MPPRDLCQWGRRSFLPLLDLGLEGRLGRIRMGGTPLPTAWTLEVGRDEVRLRYRLQLRLGQWPCPVWPGLLSRSTLPDAGISVPAVAGMRFSAVAEVHSSAVDDDDDTSVVRASEQRSDVSLDPRTAPGRLPWRGYQFRNR